MSTPAPPRSSDAWIALQFTLAGLVWGASFLFIALALDGLSPAQVADLDRTFRLSSTGNSEVLFAWLRIAIRHRYEPAMGALERFLTSQGRRKFLRPLYEDLMATDWGRAEAKRIYERARPLYHSVATGTLDPIVLGAPRS